MERLNSLQHIDLHSTVPADQRYSTDGLFGEQRGKMFGVLNGTDSQGNERVLYAFSGQFNGLWNIPGWAPPLFNEANWHMINFATEKKIKMLGNDLENLKDESTTYLEMKRLRKRLSQKLMSKIHRLYTLQNFRGERCTLKPFFSTKRGIPTGTGDCCAPKLLSFAVHHNITPLGMSEFYWGKTNKSKSKINGCFYPPCEDKCKPLLAFLLCGLDERTA